MSLRQDENELITRVGPGTPMGNFMREDWVPAMLSSEVPTPDSNPIRVMLLGEQLDAFRDTSGAVGYILDHVQRGETIPVPRPPLKSLVTIVDLERLGFARWLADNRHINEGG